MGYIKNNVVVSIVACSFLTTNINANISDFMNRSLGTSITSENAGYYKSQVSGFISGGSTRVRWGGGETIRPFSMSAPSFNVGCSGIDMVFGGFSYLNFEYLVEKLKKIASAAPAFAFKIALSTLCKDCDTIMSELEKIANMINSMNFDTCQMMTNWSDKFGKMLSEESNTGQSDSWLSSFSQGVDNVKSTIDEFVGYVNNGPSMDGEDPKDNAAKLLGSGSLIKKVLEKGEDAFFRNVIGTTDYEGLLRGVFGDVVSYKDEKTTVSGNEGGEFKTIFLPPTIEPKEFIDALWDFNQDGAKKEIRYTAYDIKKDGNNITLEPIPKEDTLVITKSMRTMLNEKFKAIVGKIAGGSTLDDADKELVSSSPLPVVDILNIEATGKGFNGDVIYEYISLLMLNGFIDELFAEFHKTINILQGMDKDFVNNNKEKIAEFNTRISIVRNETRDIMEKMRTEFSQNDAMVQQVQRIIQNFYGISDINNNGSGR